MKKGLLLSIGLAVLLLFPTLGQANFCLSFDGGDQVLVPYSPSLNPSQITIECWVNCLEFLTSPNQANWLVCNGHDVTYGHYALGQSGPEPYSFFFELGPFYHYNLVYTIPQALEIGRWYHVAGTYDGTTMRIYLDGALQDTKNVPGFQIGNTCPITFGRNGDREYFHFGELDEVRIWNYARSQEEIARDMNRRLAGNEPGLVGYWNFDEDLSDQNVYDSSPLLTKLKFRKRQKAEE
jgi:hypothetical protein